MFHLIPAPLHRLALRIAHSGRKLWWRVRKPLVTGVVVIAHDPAGRLLLVRHTYGSGLWTLPAGGLHRGEDPAAGAAREFSEELGCAAGPLVPAGILEGSLHGAPSRMHVFSGALADTPRPDGREIAEARFFAPDSLPNDAAERVWAALALLKQR